jgi:hypothetical protein
MLHRSWSRLAALGEILLDLGDQLVDLSPITLRLLAFALPRRGDELAPELQRVGITG